MDSHQYSRISTEIEPDVEERACDAATEAALDDLHTFFMELAGTTAAATPGADLSPPLAPVITYIGTDGVTAEQIAAVDAVLDDLDFSSYDPNDDGIEPVKPDALPEAVKPDDLVKPDALPVMVKPDALVTPDAAAAKAALEAAIAHDRHVKEHAEHWAVQRKASRIAVQMARDTVRALERAEAMNAEAASPMTQAQIVSLAASTYSPRKSDPVTTKASKKARDDRHLAVIKADPKKYREYLDRRNEAQNRRRAAKKGSRRSGS